VFSNGVVLWFAWVKSNKFIIQQSAIDSRVQRPVRQRHSHLPLSTQAQVNKTLGEIAGVQQSIYQYFLTLLIIEIKILDGLLSMHVMTVCVSYLLIMLKQLFRWCGCLRQELSRPLLESGKQRSCLRDFLLAWELYIILNIRGSAGV
jgi:hypothetical protein